MGQKVTFDPYNFIIQVDQAPTLVDGEMVNEIDGQIDIYSDAKEDWKTDAVLPGFYFPIRVVGGDVTPSGALGSTYFLLPPWKIRPHESSHRMKLAGNIYSEDGKSIMTPTLGNYNVIVELEVSNLIDRIISGSGVTDQDKLDIADRIWDGVMLDHVTAGTFGEAILKILALLGENQITDLTTFDTEAPPNMLTARIRLFETKTDLDAATKDIADPPNENEIAIYDMTATYLAGTNKLDVLETVLRP